MPRKLSDVRRAKSGAGEGDWYATPQGRRQTEREFARAMRAGVLVRSTGLRVARTDAKILERLMEQAKENATRAISIRIPVADLERAKRIAESSGVGYQAVLKKPSARG